MMHFYVTITRLFSDLTELKNPTPDITIRSTGQTWVAALSSLLSQIDGSKVTVHSRIKYGPYVYPVFMIDTDNNEYRYGMISGYVPTVAVTLIRLCTDEYCNIVSLATGQTTSVVNNSANPIAIDILFYY